MFDFTQERILNDLSAVTAATGALTVQRTGKFLAAGVPKVYKNAGYVGVKEVNTTTLPATGNTGGVYRLNVAVTTSGQYPIDYDRWAINKGKPFYVEALIPTGTYTADQLATALLPKLQKGLLKYNGQNITDLVITKGTGTIIITAKYEFQRLNVLIELEDDAGENWTTIATGATTTAGKQGFGTSWYILQNLRIPTQEATRFFGEDQDERPVSGVLYNQYTFEYQADRNFTGQGAVGQMIKSKTTHVFYLPATLATTFEGNVTTAFGAGSLVDAKTGTVLNA